MTLDTQGLIKILKPPMSIKNIVSIKIDENVLEDTGKNSIILKETEDPIENNDLKISLFHRFKKSMLNYLEYSTIGGLAELAKRKDLYLRIFWMIVVLMSSSYALVTIVQKIKIFYNYEFVLEFYKFQEIPTKFPAITICNQNPFNEKYAFIYLKDILNVYYDYGYYNPEQTNISQSNKIGQFLGHLFELSMLNSIYTLSNTTIKQLSRILLNDLNKTELSNIGYDLDTDMLISCQFNGNSCSESNGDFKKFWNNIYGNCYTLNRGNSSYLIGNQHELQLEMKVCK